MTEWEEVKPQRKSSDRLIQVEVTASHIRHGIRVIGKEQFGDPISLALKEITNANWAMTGWGYARTGHDGNIQKSWSLSPFKLIREFLALWDSGRRVSPITITAFLEDSIDKTPKPTNRKPRRQKPFVERQRELGL